MADKPQINSPGEEKGLQELEKELEKIRDEIRAARKKQDRPQALRGQIEEAKKELAAITGDTHGKITFFSIKIFSEYDQEIPQSQTADQPMAPRGSHTKITRHQEDKLSKATSSRFPIKMIAKLE